MLYDKKGIEIHPFDVLKVFHFIGARRKKHYMYKMVQEVVFLGKEDCANPYLKISHLDRNGDYYHEAYDGRQLKDYEIVQGFGLDGVFFEHRKRRKTNENV